MNWLLRRYWHAKLKGSPYQRLFETARHHEYVSLDCETTSLNPKRAELVTIAATKSLITALSPVNPLRCACARHNRSTRVQCGSPYPPPNLHDGLSEKEALLQLIEFIGNRPLVGYHIRYDKTILDIACRKHLGFPLPNRLIEVSQIYHDKLEKHLPNAYFNLSLEAICRHLDLPLQDKHDALQDAIAAALVFVRLTKGDLPQFIAPGV